MAYEISVMDYSWPANADLSAKQFYGMQLTTTETVDIADATVRCVGVLQNAPTTGQAASIRMVGITRAIVDGSGTAIVVMDALAPNASGILVKSTADNDEIIGYALQASTAANDYIAVFANAFKRY